MKTRVVPERLIQKAILAWLETTKLLCWRQNSGTMFIAGKCIKVGPAGLPDIIVVVPPDGRFIGLEVKSAAGTLRPAQVEFARKLTATGGVYAVVRSVKDAQKVLAEFLGRAPWDQLKGGRV